MAVPDTYLNPGNFITTDNSAANTLIGEPFRTIIIGQKTSAGTATADTLTQVFSASDASAQFGVGSMLAEMFGKWFEKNTVNPVYAIPLDDASGTQGTQTLTVTGD